MASFPVVWTRRTSDTIEDRGRWCGAERSEHRVHYGRKRVSVEEPPTAPIYCKKNTRFVSMIQVEPDECLRTSHGSTLTPREGNLVLPCERGLAVVVGGNRFSWVETEQFKTAPIQCGHFAVSAVPFLVFRIGAEWVGAAPLNAFLMKASCEEVLSEGPEGIDLVFALAETARDDSSESHPSERSQPQESGAAATSNNKNGAIEGPSGVRGDGRRGEPTESPTSSSRAATSSEEPSSEESSGSGSGDAPLGGLASECSGFPLSQLDGDKSGRVRATRTVRPPTDLMASVRRSAQAQCRAYASGREVRKVIQAASEQYSSAQMASRTQLAVCSPPGETS